MRAHGQGRRAPIHQDKQPGGCGDHAGLKARVTGLRKGWAGGLGPRPPRPLAILDDLKGRGGLPIPDQRDRHRRPAWRASLHTAVGAPGTGAGGGETSGPIRALVVQQVFRAWRGRRTALHPSIYLPRGQRERFKHRGEVLPLRLEDPLRIQRAAQPQACRIRGRSQGALPSRSPRGRTRSLSGASIRDRSHPAISRDRLPGIGRSMSYVPAMVIAGCVATVITLLVGDRLEDRR